MKEGEKGFKREHIGSDFDEFLKDEGILDHCEVVAAKRINVQIDGLKEEDRLAKSCMGKVAHNTKDGALIALRKSKFDNKQVVYRCKSCDKWHIGSDKKGRKRKLRKRRQ